MLYSNGLTSDVARILNNVVKTIAVKTGESPDSEYKKYMHVRTGADRITTDDAITGLGMADFVAENEITASDAPIQGFTKNFTQQYISKKVRLSAQTMHFLFKNKDKAKITSKVEKEITNVTKALEQTKEYYAQHFLSQWTASFTFSALGGVSALATIADATTADGVKIWSQAHLREDGGANWSNIIVDGVTASPAFSVSALEAAHRGHAQKKDGRGLPLGGSLDTLFCLTGSAVAQQAKRIKGDLDKGIYPATNPGVQSAYNASATIPSFKMVELRNYGGNGVKSTQWFMFDTAMVSEDMGLQYIESMSNTIQDVEYKIENAEYVTRGDCYFTMGANDMRLAMGSFGDGLTV